MHGLLQAEAADLRELLAELRRVQAAEAEQHLGEAPAKGAAGLEELRRANGIATAGADRQDHAAVATVLDHDGKCLVRQRRIVDGVSRYVHGITRRRERYEVPD